MKILTTMLVTAVTLGFATVGFAGDHYGGKSKWGKMSKKSVPTHAYSNHIEKSPQIAGNFQSNINGGSGFVIQANVGVNKQKQHQNIHVKNYNKPMKKRYGKRGRGMR